MSSKVFTVLAVSYIIAKIAVIFCSHNFNITEKKAFLPRIRENMKKEQD